jgi:DNA-binding NarL/FixJ family response regulator
MGLPVPETQSTGSKIDIRILVIDDFPAIRHGITNLLNRETGMKVVGEAGESASGLSLIQSAHPDILLLDLDLGNQLISADLIETVISESPTTKVVVYTAHDRENLLLESIRSGARAYVLKSSRLERLFEAIRVVANGGSYLDPGMRSLVFNKADRHDALRLENSCKLTKREREVLSELVSGKRNREIAEALFISERTVKFHIKSMFAKLQVKTRTEIVKIAIERGYV